MSPSLPTDWIDRAAAHGSTKWLKQFIRVYLPQLQTEAIAPAEFAQRLQAEFEARGLQSIAQQKNYRSNVVQALKVLDEQHEAIALVSPTAEEYKELNEAQRGRLVERETQYFTSGQAEQLVQRATRLLESSEWSEVGAGLAVLVGRRISEILLSDFSLKSAWSLNFSNMAKHADANGLTIEVPTLAPAESVLKAILKLQQSLKIEDLKVNALISKMAKQKVNAKFSGAIAAKCNEQFAGLVPPRSGKDDLYTHLFRAVYATIAAYWFCPPTVPEHSFKAEIQGHFTIAANGKKLPNFSARANYDDYAIGDGKGNRDGRLGIKLGTLPQLEVIEVFRKPVPKKRVKAAPVVEPEPIEQESVEDRQNDRSVSIAPTAETDGKNMPMWEDDRTHRAEGISPAALEKPTANAIRFRAANLLGSARVSQAQRLVALQLLSGLSIEQLEQATLKAIDPFLLEVDGVQVRTLVQHLLPHIEQLRQLPMPSVQEVEQVLQAVFDHLPVQPHNLQQIYSLIAHPSQPDSRTMMTAKPNYKRSPLYADDLDHMHKLMAKFGIGGNSAEVFHALLDAFEQGQILHQQQQTQTLSEVAQTLNWFTTEIEHLKGQILTLQKERDQLRDNLPVTAENERLQAENQRLKTELHQTQARLDRIQQLIATTDPQSTQRGMAEQQIDAIAPALAQQSNSLPTALTATAQPPKPPKGQAPVPPTTPLTRRGREETAAIIHQIIDALLAWNTAQDDSERQLRISIPIVKDIATPLGANYQPVIQQVIKDRELELEQHHSQFMLGIRHNATVTKKDQILQTIAQHYLTALQ